MSLGPLIGYVGVDVLNNATICNEATGLLEAGVALDVVSVYRIDRPTFYMGTSLERLSRGLRHLYPLRPATVLCDLARAPFVFGRRFFGAVWGAFSCPVDRPGERLRLLGHLLPGLRLAMLWKGRPIGHIHAHWAHTATTVAMHASAMLGVGFSFTGHANDLFVHRVGLPGKLRRARFAVCISEFHRRFYLAMGADPARLPVVYCGIDLDRFAAAPRTPRGRPRIVGVGRLVEKKGFADLIDACALLRDRGLDFDCVIAGSGPLKADLRGRIERLHLDDLVSLPASNVLQEDLPELLRTADVFALPCVRDSEGDMDGLPQVLIEAMALGIPAVSTRLVGIPDLVRDGVNGLLVAPGDVESLADALERLLGDHCFGEALGSEAAAWARGHFGRGETVERLARLFRRCCEHPGAGPPDFELSAAPGADAEYSPRPEAAALEPISH